MISLLRSHNKTSIVLLNSPTVDVSIRGETGDTYLAYASLSNGMVIQRLLDLGVNPLTPNVIGSTAMHEMAHHNNEEGVALLCEADLSTVDEKGSKDNYTPLHWAAREGAVGSLKILVEKGADVNAQGFTGNTPLHICIHHYVEKSKKVKKTRNMKYHKNYSASIVTLCNAKSDLEALSREGRSALSALCRIQPEFVRKKFGGEEAFKTMLDLKAKVNVRSSRGLTPIHYASFTGNWALVKMLVEYGADVNLQGSDGYSALGSLEKKIAKKGARAAYGSNFVLMERVITTLLEAGAIRRAHKDVPVEENTNEITYIRNAHDGTYQMKAATIPAMIARLTHRVFYSALDVRSFILQYHKFCTPEEVLRSLERRFFPSSKSEGFGSDGPLDLMLLGERRSVLCFLEIWLSSNGGNPAGFENEDSECTIILSSFVEKLMDTKCLVSIDMEMEPVLLPYLGDFAQNMHPTLWSERWTEQHKFLIVKSGRQASIMSESRMISEPEMDFSAYEEVYRVVVEASGTDTKASKLLGMEDDVRSIKDFTPQELAQQLTLMVHAVFCEIHIEEFVDNRYKSLATGANFQRLKQTTNKISFVLLSAILAEADMTERAKVIKLMIMTAENCLTCENFDMFVSIISVLGSSAIHRLKQTWAKVHKMLPGKWDTIQKASGGAGRNLEKKMSVLKPPCVPCIGLVLRMLINLDEEPKHIDESKSLINFHKLRKMGGVFDMIENAKSVPYSFEPNTKLLRLLNAKPEYGNEDQCWNRSRAIEAKLT